jgi:signal peptidase II
LLYILFSALIVAADQLVKYWMAGSIGDAGRIVLIPGLLNLRYAENTGAAFSMLSNATWLLALLSIVLVAAMFYVLNKTKKYNSRLLRLALLFIIGGAIGNMIDRIFLGFVRDMIEFTFVNFAVFNVADSFVCIGAVLLGVFLLFFWDKNKKLTGIIANVACPSQVVEHRSFISSDYWGKVKILLREKFGQNLYVLGLCSAAGDQCPRI